MKRVLLVGGLAVISLVCLGCGASGPSLKPASGTVTYQGKPVEGASVVFSPGTGPQGTGTTDAAGKYTISTEGKPGAVVGAHQVTISKTAGGAVAPASAKPEDMIAMAQGKSKQGAGGFAAPKAEIPAQYSLPQTTTLKADVTADAAKNVFDFPLAD